VTRKPRTDAVHNRVHILDVARQSFAEDGLDLPVREIARRAGIGVATVYRHFPARPDLVAAVLDERVRACTAEMREALADPDPWRALKGTILRFADRQVRDRGLNEALLGAHGTFAAERRAHARDLGRLVDRARAVGAVRDGVTVADVRVGLLAISSFQGLPPPGISRRPR
jgi:AcrR family transcriptional regulator